MEQGNEKNTDRIDVAGNIDVDGLRIQPDTVSRRANYVQLGRSTQSVPTSS